MTHKDMTIDDMVAQVKRKLNVATAPVHVAVEKGTIVRYAQYTGETNPVFFDEEYARTTRFGGIIAPPTFMSWFLKGIVPDQVFDFDLPIKTTLHTDDVVEIGEYVRPGDVITAIGVLTDVFVRQGRNGPMLFQSGDVNLTNQYDQFVGMIRTVSVQF